MWIQRMSGTLSGFSVSSGKHVCPALQGLQGVPLVSISVVWGLRCGDAGLLACPRFQNLPESDRNSFLVMSRQLIVDLLLRGSNRGVPKPSRRLPRVIPPGIRS